MGPAALWEEESRKGRPLYRAWGEGETQRDQRGRTHPSILQTKAAIIGYFQSVNGATLTAGKGPNARPQT